MAEGTGSGTGAGPADTPSPRYRAVIIGMAGDVLRIVRLNAANDPTALIRAGALADGCAVELWDGVRRLHHFPPKG